MDSLANPSNAAASTTAAPLDAMEIQFRSLSLPQLPIFLDRSWQSYSSSSLLDLSRRESITSISSAETETRGVGILSIPNLRF
ncbi:unnamed protein product [Linum trigynum]|uniref:Uncharacterized protein n=1 Tax=Linum trigynum TaxID=586398 RepID=A0AAV2FMU1_9ROSI